ncbi:MAG: cytochrome c [Magnetococcales bacterium]|nr:cytochrome c [Magnetococcales bacterium]
MSLVVLAACLFPGSGLAGSPFRGEKLFATHCALCHGPTGHGEMPGVPDLTWQGGRNNGLLRGDGALIERIGRGNRACPGFAGILSGEEIGDIVTFMRVMDR